MDFAAHVRQHFCDQGYRLEIGSMIFAKPGLTDSLQRDQGGELCFQGVLYPQRE